MSSKKVVLEVCNEDRISNLPDDILCRILSFMDTKYSLRTSILSTRWNHLFTLVPILEFQFDFLRDPSANTTSFIRFVNSVFLSYNVSRMDQFCLRVWDSGHQLPQLFPVVSWISAAVHRHAEQILVDVDSIVPRTLPRDLFSCNTLTKLVLQGRFNVVLPRSVCLPCLKTCSLGDVWFNDDSARNLFRSWPVLEGLYLSACNVGEGVDVINVSVPTLSRFVFYDTGNDFRLVLDVPNLVYFQYVGPAENEIFMLGNLKSLLEASIYYTRDNGYANLIHKICHVDELQLSRNLMEAVVCSGGSLPIFNSLTSLTVGPFSSLSSRLLQGLLDNSPRLEYLYFNHDYQGFEFESEDEDGHLLPDHVPACVSLHLKEVKFGFFKGLDYDRKLIKYFLKYAKKLEKMHIRCSISWNEEFDISSAACRVAVDVVDWDEDDDE